MAEKRGVRRIVLRVIIALIILIIFYPTIENIYIDIHNSMINRKCVTESDCAIKSVGPGMCYGMSYGCVNKNSFAALPKNEGWLAFIYSATGRGFVHCATQQHPPDSCVCQNNTCRNKICDPGNPQDCYISKG